MKQKAFIALSVSILLFFTAQAQNDEYRQYIRAAETHLMANQYHEAAESYSKAFIALGGKGYENDRYNAACAWALVNNPDSAFFQLFRIATKMDYSDITYLTADKDLNSLHADKRWDELCNIVKVNKDKKEANLDRPLVAILDTVYMEDQQYRRQVNEVEEKYGRDSKEMKDLWKIMEEKDKENLVKVTKILDTYGWLGADRIGEQGNSTLFLVIQHADHKTQLKYLPMMREAVKNNKARPSSLALLEDKVALRDGKKQIYGSQIGRFASGEFYVQPLEDPDNVDKRRAEVGLQPLTEYVSLWQLKWDAEAYKKQLPEIEKYEQERRAKKQ